MLLYILSERPEWGRAEMAWNRFSRGTLTGISNTGAKGKE
jgi:hypothetical protein